MSWVSDLSEYFNTKFDQLAEFFTEWANKFYENFFKVLDTSFSVILEFVMIPFELLLMVAPTTLIESVVDHITDPKTGLYKLINEVSVINHFVDINAILGVLGTCLMVYVGVLVYKVVSKLIPFIG